MTIGMSASVVDAVLAAYFQGVSFANAALWVQPHIGDPGGDGTDNLAAETTRVDGSGAFGTDPADDPSTPGQARVIVSDADIGVWSAVPATEDWTHCSFWSGETGGDFLGSGALTTSKSVTLGDDVTITAGHVTARIPNAA